MSKFVVTRLADGRIYMPAGLPAGASLPRTVRVGRISRGKHPKATIVTEAGFVFTVPYAPNGVTISGMSPTFDTVARAGRRPLILQSAPRHRTMTFDLILGTRDRQESIAPTIRALVALAGTGARMRVRLDEFTRQCLWRMTSCDVAVEARQHGTNAPTRATASVTFLEAVDPVRYVGPVTGGAVPPKPPRTAARPAARVHVVVKGDTLWAIARKFYGRGELYPRIADANKIRNPHLIYPGQRFRIPA